MKTTTTTIRLMLLIGILVFCSINSSADQKDYDGEMIQSTEFKNQKINSIQVGYSFEVRIIKTNSQSDNRIELNVSKRVEPYVKASLSGGVLSVSLEETPRNFSTKGNEMFIDIYTEELSAIRGSGAADFTVLDGFDYKTLTLIFSGASEIKFESAISAESDVEIKGSGASDFQIGNLNTEGKLSIHLSGASDFEIENVSVAGVVQIGLSGASDVSVNTMNVSGGFNYSMSGSSDMSIDNGECQSSDNRLKCSGASDYNAPEFVVNSMLLTLSGGSSAKVNVLGEINVSVGGGANLRYKSNPDTKIANLEQKSNIRSF